MSLILIFSKNRPLQLDGLLRSLKRNCKDLNSHQVKVLYTSTDDKNLYFDLIHDYLFCEFIRESSFQQDFYNCLNGFNTVLFIVDDTLFTQEFNLSEGQLLLLQNELIIGISLRLGFNSVCDFPSSENVCPHPSILCKLGNLYLFDWREGKHNYGYPLEVSSSLYRVKDVTSLSLNFSKPNSLESELASKVTEFASKRPLLAMYQSSRGFSIPFNMVQTEGRTTFSASTEHATDNLIKLYNQGLRIDTEKYYGYVPRGCHELVQLCLSTPPEGVIYHRSLPTLKKVLEIIRSKQKGVYLRFGDGDVNLANGENDMLQQSNETLANEMREALALNGNHVLKCLPLIAEKYRGVEKCMSHHTATNEWADNIVSRVKPFWGCEIRDVYCMMALHYVAISDERFFIQFMKELQKHRLIFIGNENVPPTVLSKLFGTRCTVVKTPSTGSYSKINEIEEEVSKAMTPDYTILVFAMGCSGRVLEKRIFKKYENIFIFDFGSLLDALCGWNTRAWITECHKDLTYLCDKVSALDPDPTYDRFLSFCRRVITDDNLFKTFKQDSDLTYMLEHMTPSQGKEYLECILKSFYITEKDWEGFRKNDLIGSPILVDTLPISPSSLRYVWLGYLALKHYTLVGNKKEGISIVEIGGGYGGQALIILNLAGMLNLSISRYRIIDVDEVCKLQRKYLDVNKFPEASNVETTPFLLSEEVNYDLLISNYAYSELSTEWRCFYYQNLVKKVPHVFMVYNNPIIDMELSNKATLISELPKTGESNFILFY